MKLRLLYISILPSLLLLNNIDAYSGDIQIDKPNVIISNIESSFTIPLSQFPEFDPSALSIEIDGEVITTFTHDNEKLTIVHHLDSSCEMMVSYEKQSTSLRLRVIPLWVSVLPPLIAILLALVFKEVFSALFIGVLGGSILIAYNQGASWIGSLFKGIFSFIDTILIDTLANSDHLSVIVFSLLIGAMVTLISRNGGMTGVVNVLAKYAKSPRSGQFVTWLLGLSIFFDDYANTLVVGNTMRPVTDRLRISREKLSYIVDSTAAPVAAIAFVTTWIGAELGYIQDGISTIGLTESAYSVFLNSLAYSYYPVFALIFILILVWTRKDFGPMLNAELKARASIPGTSETTIQETGYGNLKVADDITPKWYNAVIPVVVVVGTTIAGLIITGHNEVGWQSEFGVTRNISAVLGAANSYHALLWGSILGVLVSVILTQSQRILELQDSIEALIGGIKTMMTAVLILVLAWSLASITEIMHTADFITQILVNMNTSPFILPTITFIMAGLIAFSTGSSWGTMAILYPLILPASWLISTEYGLEQSAALSLFYNVVSTVLAGSVLGDHCSPISDTTILSSLASSCNHIDHVKTQLPYALTVGGVSVVVGTLPAAYGIPGYIMFPAGILVLFLIVRYFGKSTI
jgi:Na+/H+ antiporter NhaC